MHVEKIAQLPHQLRRLRRYNTRLAEGSGKQELQNDAEGLRHEEEKRSGKRVCGAGLCGTAGGVQGAGEEEGDGELEELARNAAAVEVEEAYELLGGRLEGEAEGLVPPAAPPPAQAFVQDRPEGAEGVRVHPGRGAGADDARAEQADEEEGRQGEDAGEGPFDGVEGDEEAVDAGEDGGGADEGGQEGGRGSVDDAPEVGVV